MRRVEPLLSGDELLMPGHEPAHLGLELLIPRLKPAIHGSEPSGLGLELSMPGFKQVQVRVEPVQRKDELALLRAAGVQIGAARV